MLLEFVDYQVDTRIFQFKISLTDKAELDNLYALQKQLLTRQIFHKMPLVLPEKEGIFSVLHCDSVEFFLSESKKCFLDAGFSQQQWRQFLDEISIQCNIESFKNSKNHISFIAKDVFQHHIFKHINVFSKRLRNTNHFFHAQVNPRFDILLRDHFPDDYLQLTSPDETKEVKLANQDYEKTYSQASERDYQKLSIEHKRLITLFKNGGPWDEIKEAKVTPDALCTIKDINGVDLLEWAAKLKHQALLDACFSELILPLYLTKKQEIELTKKDSKDRTILHWAVLCNQSEAKSNFLLDDKIDINAVSTMGTPLSIAVSRGFFDWVKRLCILEKINLDLPYEYQLPLSWAVIKNHFEIVKYMTSLPNIALNGIIGCASPLICAAKHGRKIIVEFLLTIPTVNASHYVYPYDNAILAAALNKHWHIVQLLMEKTPSIDFSLQTQGGNTLVMIAAIQKEWEWARRFADKPNIGINQYNSDGKTLLAFLAEEDQTEILALYLLRDDLDLNAGRDNYYNVLNFAVCANKLAPFLMLVSRPDVDPNRKNYYGNHSPLHVIAISGSYEFAKALLSHPNIKISSEHSSPDHDAITHAAKGHNMAIVILISQQLKFLVEYLEFKKKLYPMVKHVISNEVETWCTTHASNSVFSPLVRFLHNKNPNTLFGLVERDFAYYLAVNLFTNPEANYFTLAQALIQQIESNKFFKPIKNNSLIAALRKVQNNLQASWEEKEESENDLLLPSKSICYSSDESPSPNRL